MQVSLIICKSLGRYIFLKKLKKVAQTNYFLQTSNQRKQANYANKKIAEIDNELKESIKSDYKKAEIDAVERIKTDPKHFYSFAKKRSKVKTKIGPLEKADGTLTKNDQEIANLLNQTFESAFTKPSEKYRVDDPFIFFQEDDTDDKLMDIEFNIEDIEKILKSLEKGKSSGPDSFPVEILKECATELAPFFHKFIRISIDKGEIPSLLKLTKITPLPKGGNKKFATNMRPVALTSHIIKVIERLIKREIVKHLTLYSLIHPKQHGFIPEHSTLSQLLEHYEEIFQLLEEHGLIDLIFLDFAKAFDKSDFGIILRSLKKVRITGKIGIWISQFLNGRKQFVCANGTKSDSVEVKSGSIQGSILGPILFIIALNSMFEEVNNSQIGTYADDTKVKKKVMNESDSKQLQDDLNSIYKWAEENNMEFNSKKFMLMRFGKNQELSDKTFYLDPEGNKIKENDLVKDLGYWASNDCSSEKHIDKIVQSASNVHGWILRTFETRDHGPMKTLLKSLIIPILDYCSPLYHPNSISAIMKLEQPIRAFTRKFKDLKDLNYWERLEVLNLSSSERRRERFIILYMYKILMNLVPNPGITWQENERTGIKAKVPKRDNKASTNIKNLRENFFTTTGPKLFNSMPLEVRNFSTDGENKVLSFKNNLDKYLSFIPDQPHVIGIQSRRPAATNSIMDQIFYRRPSNIKWSFCN